MVESKGRAFDLCALESSRGYIMEAPQLAARRGQETGWDLSRTPAESSFLESGDCRSLAASL